MRYFCIGLLLWFSTVTFAAIPVADQFIVDGVPHEVDSRPLDKLHQSDEIRLKLQNQLACAADQRGYTGVWELKGQQLFLNTLQQKDCKSAAVVHIDPQLLFGETQYPLKANWFSGAIKVPLTDKDYKHCLTDEGSDETIGYAYLAMVYEFIAGELVKQSEQIVTENWQRPRSNCANVPTARV
ncbi:MAG: hypothetical protein KJ556_08920 [Gammaproteobacteria bacterium]|nr:hypothetical protein [Gammaproteobacteria bacterium]MBU2059386.1 hypothetical protein [Gammaproteobacteria bacterium]MBU2175234.1 hypothetical protein [Gammaproteobacteria bacterium]MBU2247442.1 hypothetical protein [Gammaproteobacteria bacterium]MBU2346291.1 hypothetical protein [Gammaproteobacteria bacterium]